VELLNPERDVDDGARDALLEDVIEIDAVEFPNLVVSEAEVVALDSVELDLKLSSLIVLEDFRTLDMVELLKIKLIELVTG
jgi:hypothetical protein